MQTHGNPSDERRWKEGNVGDGLGKGVRIRSRCFRRTPHDLECRSWVFSVCSWALGEEDDEDEDEEEEEESDDDEDEEEEEEVELLSLSRRHWPSRFHRMTRALN